MEKLTPSLIMAGSILISIMVITLLVMGYNNLTETMNAKNDEDAVEQVTQFNKQYDVYYRNNLYGSDILSLANKVDDYNERQSKEQGYAKLDMEVTFTKSINAYNNEQENLRNKIKNQNFDYVIFESGAYLESRNYLKYFNKQQMVLHLHHTGYAIILVMKYLGK